MKSLRKGRKDGNLSAVYWKSLNWLKAVVTIHFQGIEKIRLNVFAI